MYIFSPFVTRVQCFGVRVVAAVVVASVRQLDSLGGSHQMALNVKLSFVASNKGSAYDKLLYSDKKYTVNTYLQNDVKFSTQIGSDLQKKSNLSQQNLKISAEQVGHLGPQNNISRK